MTALTEEQIAGLLQRYLQSAPGDNPARIATRAPIEEIYPKLSAYLGLLLRWNERINLTAVRDPTLIVVRHFGESLFAATRLASLIEDGACVLDFGSGAGFPGIPMQLLLPRVRVTLAECQSKKAAFLREAVRVLGLSADVWADRVERLPAEQRFDVVAMRAVDRPGLARSVALEKVRQGGWLLGLVARDSQVAPGLAIPGPRSGSLRIEQV